MLLVLQACAIPTPLLPPPTPTVTSTSTLSQTPAPAPASAVTPAFSREQAIQKAIERAGHGPGLLNPVGKRIDSVTADLITLAEMDDLFYGEQRQSYEPGQNQGTRVWLVSVRGYFGFQQKGVSTEQPLAYMADGQDLAYDASTGRDIAARSLGLGVVVVPPLGPKIGDQVVSAPASRMPIAGEDAVWGLVAGWARDVSPVLRPQSLPQGFESVQVLDARQGTFRVEYTGPGKSVLLGAGAFNPPHWQDGEQRSVVVRGQATTMQTRSRVQPTKLVQVWWQEPGRWVQAPNAAPTDNVFYLLSAKGLDPDAVVQLANSLRPM